MNEFWTTVLSTAGAAACASAIVSGVITSIASIWLQHVYDKKLEEHKEHVQKKIDKHQIQFEYWHKEKAKAIKEFYYSAVMWYQEMSAFRAVSQMYVASPTAAIQQRLNLKMERVLQLNESAHRDWTYLRLFLEKEELLISDHLFTKGGTVFDDIGSQYQKDSYALKKETMEKELKEMIIVIEDLREKLQDILKVQEAKR